MPWGPSNEVFSMEAMISVLLRTPGLFVIDCWYWYQRNKSADPSSASFTSEVVAFFALANGFLLLLLPLSLLRTFYTYFLPILACYTLPVMGRLAHVNNGSIHVLHNLCFFIAGLSLIRCFFFHSIASLFSSFKGTFNRVKSSISSIQGLVELVISFMGRIIVPIHFLVFFIISLSIKLHHTHLSTSADIQDNESWFLTLLSSAAAVCDSPISLLSVAVTITYLSHVILSAVKLYLPNTFGYRPHALTNDNEDPDQVHFHHIGPNDHRANQLQPRAMHTGWEEGVTTLLLAALTGITELNQSARMSVLTIIFFVVISSLLQSMLDIAEPVILSLSSHHGKNLFHHIKVLLLCGFLFGFPLHITYVLTTVFPVDFWLAVVLSTSLLTSAQVLDLVIVHCLLWFDATRSEPWEPLDEVVYYVRALTKVIEFLVAFSVVVVGVYEGMIGQWNWTNAMILIVHCYFNVCQRFQSGLKSFIQRRRAVQKSANLPAASTQQLQEYKDICAICFMDMVTVPTSVITPCCHFFHRVCLRRWLSFHDRCPLCAAPVISDALSKHPPDCDRPAAGPPPLPSD